MTRTLMTEGATRCDRDHRRGNADRNTWPGVPKTRASGRRLIRRDEPSWLRTSAENALESACVRTETAPMKTRTIRAARDAAATRAGRLYGAGAGWRRTSRQPVIANQATGYATTLGIARLAESEAQQYDRAVHSRLAPSRWSADNARGPGHCAMAQHLPGGLPTPGRMAGYRRDRPPYPGRTTCRASTCRTATMASIIVDIATRHQAWWHP